MSDQASSPRLTALGWNTTRALEAAPLLGEGERPARVLAQHRDRYVVGTDDGDVAAVQSGRSRIETSTRLDLPSVGDWVAVRPAGQDLVVLGATLPRSSAFVRQRAGDASEAQVVAANIDVALVATSLNADLNPRRIERYVTLAWESGATPVVLLTKCDLAAPDALAAARATVGAAAPGVELIAVSTRDGSGLDALTRLLTPGSTAVLVGSSGVGKSTLVNALLGEARLETHEIRADGKGRHTTTHRELVRLACGGLLIDTPGMRELQLWSDGTGVSAAFTDVESLAAACRFRDCAHGAEPGCAVRAAVASGALEAERLESYRKLLREVAWLARRTDALASAEAKRREKMLHRAGYAAMEAKRR